MSQTVAQPHHQQAEISRKWLAAYTRSRHESRVAIQLQQKSLSILLPTYEKHCRWSDRVRRVKTPLFPGYVFVHASDAERALTLQTNGVVNIVSAAGKPCALREDEVDVLRRCVSGASGVEPHPFLKVGRKVRIRHGAFADCEGILVQAKNSSRVVIAVEQIMRSVAVNVHLADIEAVA